MRHVREVSDRRRADEERHLAEPVERLEADEAGPDEPGVVAERRLHDPELVVGGVERFASSRGLGRAAEQRPRGRPEPSSDDDELRRKDVGERADRDPEAVPDARKRGARSLVALERLTHEPVGVGTLAPKVDRQALRGPTRDDGLEMPAAVAASLARRPVGHHDDVAELRPAAVEASIEHEAPADARPERERDEVVRAPTRANVPLGERERVAVVLDADGNRETIPQMPREIELAQREVDGAEPDTGCSVEVHRDADADRRCPVLEQSADEPVELLEERSLAGGGGRDLDRSPDRAVSRDHAGEHLRPADVHPDGQVRRHDAATIPGLMPAQDKPYRVYRGGRAKGRVPLARHTAPPRTPGAPAPATSPQTPRKRRRPGRWIALGLVLLLVLLIAWAVGSYLSVASGVTAANERVPAGVGRQLAKRGGLLVSTPTTILVLGTDGGDRTGREGANRSDSIMLLRTDPGKRRLAYLSIPRDLQVEIPEYGVAKINAANQFGGPALALRTVKDLTGLDVNHVIFVDFDRFEELIDAVGGIDVDVPRRIRSNRFDCPYKTAARCAQWQGWRFERGVQHMDGRRALVYSRVRHNLLNPAETDFDRARRQQQVVAATLDKVTSVGTALRLPFVGGDLVRPLATDLTAWELMQLGWVYFRADTGRALHCRLGGDPATVGGESVILGTEDNVSTVAMFTDRSAPLPPPRGQPYAPGCLVGK
jgi:polyisoprenyl-teichoic acid--peptidoglycan teichoic acid transferase